MAVIDATELGVDEDTALQVLATARTIAPTIHDVVDAQSRAELVAILRGVAKDAARRGSLLVRGQRMGPGGVDYTDATSWFTDDTRATLRAICRSASITSSGPVGHFPKPSTVTTNMWPEQYED
jgi:hypothetical protein